MKVVIFVTSFVFFSNGAFIPHDRGLASTSYVEDATRNFVNYFARKIEERQPFLGHLDGGRIKTKNMNVDVTFENTLHYFGDLLAQSESINVTDSVSALVSFSMGKVETNGTIVVNGTINRESVNFRDTFSFSVQNATVELFVDFELETRRLKDRRYSFTIDKSSPQAFISGGGVDELEKKLEVIMFECYWYDAEVYFGDCRAKTDDIRESYYSYIANQLIDATNLFYGLKSAVFTALSF